MSDFLLKNPGGSDGVVVSSDGTTVAFKDRMTGTTMLGQGAAVASLTEDGGAVGDTNDGDLPDLTTPDAAGNAAAVREVATKLNGLLTALRAAGVITT